MEEKKLSPREKAAISVAEKMGISPVEADRIMTAAIENSLFAVTELGYASCWYEGHITDDDRICDKMAAILDVPDNYELVCFLPVGKPVTEVKAPKKKSFEERAFFNRFG